MISYATDVLSDDLTDGARKTIVDNLLQVDAIFCDHSNAKYPSTPFIALAESNLKIAGSECARRPLILWSPVRSGTSSRVSHF